MNFFQKAAAGLQLSPAERSLRKLLWSFVMTGVLFSYPLITQLVQAVTSGQANINWTQELRGIALAFAVAVLHAGAKYVTAHLDAPLGGAIDDAANWINDKAAIKTAPAVPNQWNTTTTASPQQAPTVVKPPLPLT